VEALDRRVAPDREREVVALVRAAQGREQEVVARVQAAQGPERELRTPIRAEIPVQVLAAVSPEPVCQQPGLLAVEQHHRAASAAQASVA
jgi:hypothetical protein